MIGISPCSCDVFTPLLNKLVYVLDSLMAGHYRNYTACMYLQIKNFSSGIYKRLNCSSMFVCFKDL